MVLWDMSPPSSWSASFPNKWLFLAPTPVSRFTVLSCGKQYKLELGNNKQEWKGEQGFILVGTEPWQGCLSLSTR